MPEEMEEFEEKRIGIRVSLDLYEKVVAAAKKKNMSINGYIIQTLEQAVDPSGIENRIAAVEAAIEEFRKNPYPRPAR